MEEKMNEEIEKTALLNDAIEEHDEVINESEEDFSGLSKLQLVALMEEISKSDDFKNSESKAKKLKSAYDEKLEEERGAAFEKYIAGGGEKDDFEFRKDENDKKFETFLKNYKERRFGYIKDIERQKNTNFDRKSNLIISLRALIDKIDDKNALSEVRKIQDEWKSIGAVAKTNSEELWKSYHALLDIFYSNFKSNLELIDLDRKRNLSFKNAIIEKAEALKEEPIIKNALKTISDLENEWKYIGPVAKEESNAVWERFKKAIDVIYDRKREYLANKEQEFAQNLQLKRELIDKLNKMVDFQSDKINDWKKQSDKILAIQEDWKKIGQVKRDSSDDISKEFWGAYKKFFNCKSVFFKSLHDSRLENLKAKTALCEEVEAILVSEDLDSLTNKVIDIQKRWKTIGPVPDKFNNQIWERFKKDCDNFFEKKRSNIVQKEEANKEKLSARYNYCDTLEAQIKDDSIEKNKEFITNAKNEWKTTFASEMADNKLEKKFYTLLKEAVSKFKETSENAKMDLIYELEVESLKSQTNSDELLNQKSIQLRKQVREYEDQVSNIKNNLAFFGKSKNAEAMKAEYEKEAALLEIKLDGLKKYLKVLYKS